MSQHRFKLYYLIGLHMVELGGVMQKLKDQEKPRMGLNASDEGAYEQVIKLVNPVINPGDTLEVEQFFTGYGSITGVKLGFFPNVDVFVSEGSNMISGLYEKSSEEYAFGGHVQPFDNTGLHINLTGSGIKMEAWNEEEKPTLFCDVSDNETPQIMTEMKLENPPVKYVLKTNKKIRPGMYSLEFYFTYHNGTSWKVSTRKAEFKIRNFLERHDVLIGGVAILASVSALVRFALYPWIVWLIETIKPFLE